MESFRLVYIFCWQAAPSIVILQCYNKLLIVSNEAPWPWSAGFGSVIWYNRPFVWSQNCKYKINLRRRNMSKETPLKVSIRSQDLWITRGRKASAENVNDYCRLCIKCALKLKYGAIEKISDISSENLFKARRRNDYDNGKILAEISRIVFSSFRNRSSFYLGTIRPSL
jgi:hypothetical protein